MSLRSPKQLDCPECGNIQTVDIWQSLNATIDLMARIDLFEGKINIFHCVSCGAKAQIGVPLTYHDMDRQFMVKYIPVDGLDDEGLSQTFNDDGTDREADQALQIMIDRGNPELMPEYMRRPHIVLSLMELLTYIQFRERLFDLGTKEKETAS
jgi:hypothetical protein